MPVGELGGVDCTMAVAMPGGARARVALVEFAPSGGLFQFAVQLGEGLSRRGHSVRLVTGPSPELLSREPDCRVLSILPTWHPTAGAGVSEWWRRLRRVARAGRYVLAWLRLLAWLRTTRPDAVVWSAWRFRVDAWGVRIARRLLPGTALALVAHEPRPLVEQPGTHDMYKTDRRLHAAFAKAYRCLDAVFVLGESARKVLVDQWRPRCPATVIPHGNEDVFADARSAPAAATGPRVLFFGTITAYKGLDDLLECWPRVREAVPAAELVVAGHLGADIDADALEAKVARLPGVTLQAGYVPMPRVADLFLAARVVALPYRRSSQSGVAHLAFSFARPVVATEVGDIPAVVRDGETGRLVPAGDPQALAQALIQLLRDAGLAQRLGAAGRSALDTGAGWDEIASTVGDTLVRARPGLGGWVPHRPSDLVETHGGRR